MKSKYTFASVGALLLFSAAALAQTMPVPPSALTPVGPSLSQTTNFIIREIAAESPIDFRMVLQAKNDNRIENIVIKNHIIETLTMLSPCEMKYVTSYGSKSNITQEIDLKSIESIKIRGADTSYREEMADTTVYSPLSPVYFELVVSLGIGRDGKRAAASFDFRDKDIAARVGKAFAHAAALCGGGNLEPF